MAWFLAPAIGAIGGAAIASNALVGATIGGAIGMGVAQYAGASQQASAAREQARLSNEATDRQWAYDMDIWDLEKQRLDKNREYAYETVAISARNEQRQKQFQDASRQQQYARELQIRNFDQAAANAQYARSSDIFTRQVSLNALQANAATKNELIALQEQEQEASFNKQEALVAHLKAEGEIRARGQAGRSVNKTLQAEAATLGMNMSMLSQSLANAERSTRAALGDITRERTSSDLTAYANKMLDPGILPMPLMPFEVPLTEWQYPDEIEEWEYGPQPIKGVLKSPNAAASAVWGRATPQIGQSLASGVLAWAEAKPIRPKG